MRDYATLKPRFWIQGTGKQMRGMGEPTPRELAVYLMSAPSSTMLGLYYLPVETIRYELGYRTLEGASKALRRVCETGFASYDEPTEHVFVVNMAHEQLADSLKPADKRVLGVRKELKKLRKCPLYLVFLERYAAAYCLQDLLEEARETEALRSPLEAPSKPGTGTGTGSRTGSEETDTSGQLDGDSEESVAHGAPCPSVRDPKVDRVFAHWVTVMGKDPARTHLTDDRRKKLKARRKDGYTDEQLCQAIDGCKASAWHMGANDNGEPYNDLVTILRDGKAVDAHIARLTEPRPEARRLGPSSRPQRAPATDGADFADAPDLDTQLQLGAP